NAFDPGEMHSYISMFRKTTDQLINLTGMLRRIGRIQRNEEKFSPGPLDLREISGYLLDQHSLSAAQKRITIRNQIPSGTIVWADPSYVHDVLSELLGNSVKFTRADGHGLIEIRVRPDPAGVPELCVSDNGVGIEKGVRGKLFHLDGEFLSLGTEDERGSGMGLIVCKMLADANGSDIYFEDNPSGGTTFALRIPAAKSE
ncbi:MAG: HAMP domain-containing sensor histidine kinase, partial [Candidatus Micrarchaeota archaeon]